MKRERPRMPLHVAALLLVVTGSAWSQPMSLDHTLTLADATGAVGTQVTTIVSYSNVSTDEVAGWALGVCHETALVEVVSAVSGATLATINNGGPPDFNQINVVPLGSPSITPGLSAGVNQATVISLLNAALLPPGVDYEFLEITYELLDIGSSTLEFCETTPGGAFPVTTVISLDGGFSVDPTLETATLEAINTPDYRLYLEELAVPGTSVGLTCKLDSQPGTTSLAGWSFGVCHDTSLVDPVDAVLGSTSATVNAGSPPDFSQINVIPNGTTVPPGSTVGVNSALVIDLLGNVLLPPGLDYELLEIEYAPVTLGIASFNYCDSTPGGIFDVETLLSAMGGVTIFPALDDITFEVGALELFERGDCNDDGVMDLADPIASLEYQFVDGPDVPCLDACDVNDDGMLDIADPIFHLQALFAGGPMPTAPFGACGEDPTVDGLDCAEFTSCP